MSDYSIDEASRLSGITIRSLRNYTHQYEDFLNLKRGQYNALIFSDDDLKMLVKIKSLLRDGKSRNQICDTLKTENESPTIQVTRAAIVTQEQPVILPLLKKIDTVLTDLLDENQKLHFRLSLLEESMERPKALPAVIPPPRLLSISRSGLDSGLAVPYFMLAAKDGAVALARSFWQVFVTGRTVQ